MVVPFGTGIDVGGIHWPDRGWGAHSILGSGNQMIDLLFHRL